MWSPGHQGNMGNEIADELSKNAASALWLGQNRLVDSQKLI